MALSNPASHQNEKKTDSVSSSTGGHPDLHHQHLKPCHFITPKTKQDNAGGPLCFQLTGYKLLVSTGPVTPILFNGLCWKLTWFLHQISLFQHPQKAGPSKNANQNEQNTRLDYTYQFWTHQLGITWGRPFTTFGHISGYPLSSTFRCVAMVRAVREENAEAGPWQVLLSKYHKWTKPQLGWIKHCN